MTPRPTGGAPKRLFRLGGLRGVAVGPVRSSAVSTFFALSRSATESLHARGGVSGRPPAARRRP